MKSLLALALIVSLMESITPVTAKERLAGPPSGAHLQEAGRVAFEPASARAGDLLSDWAEIRRVVPGTEILLTIPGVEAGRRYFVSADDSTVTLLNLRATNLPVTAKRVLRDMASNRQGYFTGVETGMLVDRDIPFLLGVPYPAGRRRLCCDRQRLRTHRCRHRRRTADPTRLAQLIPIRVLNSPNTIS